MQDYMLTNSVYKHPPMPTTGLAPEALQVMWGVQASFLQAALQLVDAEEGGLDGYLARKLGLSQASIAKLAQRYLE
jgi:protein-tyrosine phosphatase